MIKIVDKTKCTGCATCASICPVSCIKMTADEEGFSYPQVNMTKCINCGLCETKCPMLNYRTNLTDLKSTYACHSLNSTARSLSSSGAIFFELASYVLNLHGFVCGAAFGKDFSVEHIIISTKEELSKLQGSKYVQSNIGNCYLRIRELLNKGERVLFSGTTCQVAGLLAFLGKDYKNLITMDFICEGIPSPKIWDLYLNTFHNKEQLEFINFKNKKNGWKSFTLEFNYGKHSEYHRGMRNYYFNGYFNGLYSRPCCSSCIFKKGNRVSDITVSDCWGVDEIAPEMFDNKGLSSIIVHTQKGERVFEILKNDLNCKVSDFSLVLKNNPNYERSKTQGKNRKSFWKMVFAGNYYQACEKYCLNKTFYGFKGRLRRIKKIIKGERLDDDKKIS